jgi:WD40 repeat protein
VELWNFENGRLLNTFYLGLSIWWIDFIALPQELFVAIKVEDPQTICLFNSNTGQVVKSISGHEDDVLSLLLLDELHLSIRLDSSRLASMVSR